MTEDRLMVAWGWEAGGMEGRMNSKGHEENFGSDGNVCYLDYGDLFVSVCVCVCQKSSNYKLQKYPVYHASITS